MDNVCGLFASRDTAEKAMTELLMGNIKQSQISLVLSESTKDKLTIIGRDEAGQAAKGAVTGAVLAGGFATLLAGAVAVGGLAIPGTSLFAVGPLVAALSGGAVGAVAGGLIGALVEAGMPEAEAKKYEAEILHGSALLVVHPDTEEQASLARRTISNTGSLTAAA
jgi:outer membrane lipoprotein SlyB